MPNNGLHEFHPYTATHAAVVVAFIMLVTALSLIGRRLARRGSARPLRRTLGWLNLAVVASYLVFWLLPENFVWSSSLPLHVCDLAGWAAALALITDIRLFTTLVYFWGLCLTPHGFVTPILTEGPAHPIFWFFFLSHGVIVGTAIFEVAAGGYRPAWRDWAAAIAVTALYIAAVFLVDLATGWNYGYVGRATLDRPTALDLLGPWPLRVLWICLLGVAAFTLAMLPWECGRWRRAKGFR